MRIPQRCPTLSDRAVRLNRSLYGLKRPSRRFPVRAFYLRMLYTKFRIDLPLWGSVTHVKLEQGWLRHPHQALILSCRHHVVLT